MAKSLPTTLYSDLFFILKHFSFPKVNNSSIVLFIFANSHLLVNINYNSSETSTI